MVDGLLIVVGGTLLLAPGFITDIFGLILLIPPTRAIVRGLLKRFTIGRFWWSGCRGAASSGLRVGRATRVRAATTTSRRPPKRCRSNPNGHEANRELPPTDEH